MEHEGGRGERGGGMEEGPVKASVGKSASTALVRTRATRGEEASHSGQAPQDPPPAREGELWWQLRETDGRG